MATSLQRESDTLDSKLMQKTGTEKQDQTYICHQSPIKYYNLKKYIFLKNLVGNFQP